MGHTYAGPGATIGPALVFGYLAAEDIARQSDGAEPSEMTGGSIARQSDGAETSQMTGGSEAEDFHLRRLGEPDVPHAAPGGY
jgi:3-oxosteroid 1-dehydrogenase